MYVCEFQNICVDGVLMTYIRHFDHLSFAGATHHYVHSLRKSRVNVVQDLIFSIDDICSLENYERRALHSVSKDDLDRVKTEFKKTIQRGIENLFLYVGIDRSQTQRGKSSSPVLFHCKASGNIAGSQYATSSELDVLLTHNFNTLLLPTMTNTDGGFVGNSLPNIRVYGVMVDRHMSVYANWRLHSTKRLFLALGENCSWQELLDRATSSEWSTGKPITVRRKRPRAADAVTNLLDAPLYNSSPEKQLFYATKPA